MIVSRLGVKTGNFHIAEKSCFRVICVNTCSVKFSYLWVKHIVVARHHLCCRVDDLRNVVVNRSLSIDLYAIAELDCTGCIRSDEYVCIFILESLDKICLFRSSHNHTLCRCRHDFPLKSRFCQASIVRSLGKYKLNILIVNCSNTLDRSRSLSNSLGTI